MLTLSMRVQGGGAARNSYDNGAWDDSAETGDGSNGDTRYSFQGEDGWNPAFHISLIPSKVEHLPVAQHRIVFINCTDGRFPQMQSTRSGNNPPSTPHSEVLMPDESESDLDGTNGGASWKTTKTPSSSTSLDRNFSLPHSTLTSSRGASATASPSTVNDSSSSSSSTLLQQHKKQQQLDSLTSAQHTQTASPPPPHRSKYYIALITSADSQVAIPTTVDVHGLDTANLQGFKLDENRTDQLLLRFLPSEGSMFSVRGEHVGYGVLIVQFYKQWVQDAPGQGQEDVSALDPNDWNLTNAIYELYFSVSVVRKVRWVDMTFDCVIAAMATLNAFSIGCDSDWASLHQHLQKPTTLLLAVGCQMLVNPLVSGTFLNIPVLPTHDTKLDPNSLSPQLLSQILLKSYSSQHIHGHAREMSKPIQHLFFGTDISAEFWRARSR